MLIPFVAVSRFMYDTDFNKRQVSVLFVNLKICKTPSWSDGRTCTRFHLFTARFKKKPKQFSEIRKWDFLTWNMHDDNCWLLKAKWVNVWKMRGCQIGISFYYWLMFNCEIWIMKPDCLFINPDITNCEYWVIWRVARS